MLDWLINADHSLFFILNGMAASKALMAVALALSDFGRYPVLLLAGLVLALDGRIAFRRHILALLLIMPVAIAVNTGLKHSVHRERPQAYYHEAVARGEVEIQVGEQVNHKSFPSGHSTMAFFAMGYLAWAKRRQAWWWLLPALGVGWSRVAVGAHFPLDCVAGGALGMVWSWMAWRIYGKLEHGSWTSRKAQPPAHEPSSGSCSGC
jgi:membrane-associated phospholipid phosphatase